MSVCDPTVEVICDKCGSSEDFEMTVLVQHSWDTRDLQRELERNGWKLTDGLHGETICPECAEEDSDG